MNLLTEQYWNNYWESIGQAQPQQVSAWKFGGEPDLLAQLVIDGLKTATCSGHIFYEIENVPLPAEGEYSIVLNSKEEPVAIIKTVKVEIMPMNEVPEDFAFAEGQGDRSYKYWKEVHEAFFTKELTKIGLEFTEEMMLVLERFELIHVRG